MFPPPMKLGMGLGQEQTHIHFVSLKVSADAENMGAREIDTRL